MTEILLTIQRVFPGAAKAFRRLLARLFYLGFLGLGLTACDSDEGGFHSGAASTQSQAARAAAYSVSCERLGHRKVAPGDTLQAKFTTRPGYRGEAELVTLCDDTVLDRQPLVLSSSVLEVTSFLPAGCGGSQSFTIALKLPALVGAPVGLCRWSQNIISPVDEGVLTEQVRRFD